MNQQFLRMQQLAGVKPQPTFDNLVIEALTEYHLYVNYYSKDILKENINEGILTKAKESSKGFLTKLKNLSKKFDLSPTETLMTSLLKTVKKSITPKEYNEYIKFIKNYEGSANTKSIQQYIDKKLESTSLNESFLDIFRNKEKGGANTGSKAGLFMLLALKIGMMLYSTNASAFNNAESNIDNENVPTISTGVDLSNTLDSIGGSQKTVQYIDNLETNPSTLDADGSSSNADSNPIYVSDDGKEIKIGFGTGESEIKNVKDIAKKVYDKIKQAAGGKTIKNLPINKQGLISNLPGENDNDPKGPKKTGLASDRNEEADSVYDGIEALAKADNPDIKISLIDKGTNADDLGSEVEKDSDEAKQTQVISLDISDMETEDEKEPEKKDTPKLDNDKALFRAPRLTAPDANKYTVLTAQILPKLISDDAYKSFRKNLKLEDNEVLNDDSVAKNIERLKQENTQEAKDAINILLWARTIKKSPQTLANEFKKLDPKINLVFQGRALKPGEKGKAVYRPGSGLSQTPDAVRDQTTQLAEIYSSLLLEAQSSFSSLPGYIGDNKAKSELGYLVPIYAYNWNVSFGKDTFDYIQQGEYVSSFNKFAKDAPVIVQKLSAPQDSKSTSSTEPFDKNKKKTQPDVTRVTQAIEKDTSFKRFLGKLDNVNELSNFILALFLYRDNKGEPLFDKNFATSRDKVKSAIYGLTYRMPDKLKEADDDDLIRKFPDVQTAYTYIGKSTTLRNLLKNINTIEEFHQLILRSILPFIHPKFKTKSGVGDLKKAIISAGNRSKEFENILNKKK